jgi:hypothetical protein
MTGNILNHLQVSQPVPKPSLCTWRTLVIQVSRERTNQNTSSDKPAFIMIRSSNVP